MKRSRLTSVVLAIGLALASSVGTALAHAYPKTTDPLANARLDSTPAHILINYDSPIIPSDSGIAVLDATGAPVATTTDQVSGNATYSVSPNSSLSPGPYTVAWRSLSGEDGHLNGGFYTFVLNGGAVGIIDGAAQAQSAAADLMETLTVESAPDGGSLLRVDLNTTTGVERIRIRLSRPDLGEDLLDTIPTGDGGWALGNNEVAIPGDWHADVIVRRTNVVDDAQGGFDFSVDDASGAPTVTSAPVRGPMS